MCGCVCTCTCMHAMVFLWKAGENLWELLLCFHHVDSREYLGYEVWQQVSLPAEPSIWPLMKYFKLQSMMEKMLPRVKTLRIQSMITFLSITPIF